MSKFVSLKVKELVQATADATVVVFERPLGDEFNYKPGQYLTLKADINGESLRRAYSLCSSPITDKDTLAVAVKRVDGGRMSNFLPDHITAGQQIEVFPPMGNFTVDLDPAKKHHYVLMGGGSGITPLMSIVKSVLEVESGSKVTLFYANRDEHSIIFGRELNQLADQHPDRFRVIYTLDVAPPSWSGLTGAPTRHMLMPVLTDIRNSDALPKSFYICGPAGMMEEAQAAMTFIGVGKSDIFRELFTAPLPDLDAKAPVVVDAEGKRGTYTVAVVLDGSEHQVEVDANTTILEAVINDGIDPPYACQMGVCTTCRAKLHSGKVEMEEDEGLSDSEIADGYILTCQSHPLTADCKLEYM